jgi:uncharacterized protein (DUF1015 family)
MADVLPFRALRYNSDLDLAAAVCPPFDTISPQFQRELYERSSYNAVRIELAEDTNGGRYENAARTLHDWLRDGILSRDGSPAFYLLQQTFPYGEQAYTRTLLFARLRVVPWSDGAVLPHEQTFPKHKNDRLQLMRAAHINGSPVFLFYRDADARIHDLVDQGERDEIPVADIAGFDGQHLRLTRISERAVVEELERAFAAERLYVADGHHRYETALLYRDEVRAKAASWTGNEPENFALVGLVAADDPGLLVLPTHRVTASEAPWPEVRSALEAFFDIEPFRGDAEALMIELAARHVSEIGFAAKDADTLFVLTPKETHVIDRLLPQDKSPAWRALDYAICDYVVLRHCIGLSEEQTKDQSVLWFTEDADAAVRQVREGDATYAVILNPVPVHRVLELADAGDVMPQKSTFFYPKVPAGLVFNLLED